MPPEVYTVPPGVDVAPNLPPVALPGSSDQPRRLTIDVVKPKPPPAPAEPTIGFSEEPPQPSPRAQPGAVAAPTGAAAAAVPSVGFTEQAPPPDMPIGGGEAMVRGGIDAASFGLGPIFEALTAAGSAGKSEQEQAAVMPAGVASEAPGMEMMGLGLARLRQGDPQATAAFETTREAALQRQRAAMQQHPYLFTGGEVAGGFLTPGFGAAVPGGLGSRLATGAVAGAIGGGLHGAGGAISQEKSATDIALDAALESVLGGAAGAAFKGVVGPRAPIATSGQRAAATAAAMGKPLPRGVASDSPFVQGTTAKLMSVPFIGERIRSKVAGAEEAAGERIAGMAQELFGAPPRRAAADVALRPSLQGVIDSNVAVQDAVYDAVRAEIDQGALFAMPRLQQALTTVEQRRAIAGWPNPKEGLDQFERVARGTTFAGAHRARADARAAGGGGGRQPNPGYDAKDFELLKGAMDKDVRAIVVGAAAARGGNPQYALRVFNQAEAVFGTLAKRNETLHKLVKAQGEGAIASLLSAAGERTGNARLLAQLRSSMPPAEFNMISGMLLHELGSAATGDFSLQRFATGWKRDVSDAAKRVMFSAQHQREIDDIVNLAGHIKGASAEVNRSKTANALLLVDLAVNAGLLGATVAGSGPEPLDKATYGKIAASAGLGAVGFWLGRPAQASAIARFLRAHNAAALQPTPGRIATFKLVTRDLANNLGLDPAKVWRRVEGTIAGQPQAADTEAGQEAEQQ